MHPSLSVTLESGLDRGVPWGRDLYTFVTSAAGHMMRTLQKPRKSRPSKRQVNHRRFLHNMIQRKFADIEAANHKLASAMKHGEEDKDITGLSLPSQKPETLERPDIPCDSPHLQEKGERAGDTNKPKSIVSVCLHDTEERGKKQTEVGHLWKRHPKSQPRLNTDRKNNPSQEKTKKESRSHNMVDVTSLNCLTGRSSNFSQRSKIFSTECYNAESQPAPANSFPEDSQKLQLNSSFLHCSQNVDVPPSFSPELSPLSLDSCDFSLQTFKDLLTQKNMADISESQWTDFIDFVSVGSKDVGGCMDVEAYLESICAWQGDSGQEDGVDGVGLPDDGFGFTERFCGEKSGVDNYCYDGYEHLNHGDQGMTVKNTQEQHIEVLEIQVNNFKPSQGPYLTHDHFSTSDSYDYNHSELQTYYHSYEDSPCVLGSCENKQNCAPFEGVAQFFSAPLQSPEHRSVPTPPQGEDWLFTDILKDGKTPDC